MDLHHCHQPGKVQAAAIQTKKDRTMLIITNGDRKTNIWVREKTLTRDLTQAGKTSIDKTSIDCEITGDGQ